LCCCLIDLESRSTSIYMYWNRIYRLSSSLTFISRRYWQTMSSFIEL